MIASPDSENTEVVELERAISRDKRWLGVGIFLFVVVVGGVGGVGWRYSQLNHYTTEPLRAVAETPEPSPIQIVEIKPVFVVWNGSGIAGVAGKLADKLETNGYEVLETKNAPVEQVGTTIELTSELESQKEMILKLVGPAEVKTLRENGLEYSVKIIIGK